MGTPHIERSLTFTFLVATLVTAACSAEELGESQAEILYEGGCTKASCEDLERPATDCTDTAPRFRCAPDAAGACALDYECPDARDPGAAVSMAPCEDAACGEPPSNAQEAGCAAGQELTGAVCGKLNGAAQCAWHPGCVTLGEPIPIDPSQVGATCGGELPACPTGESCVVLPLETGLRGAHCIADPCALIGCPLDRCVTLTSYPGQVVCDD